MWELEPLIVLESSPEGLINVETTDMIDTLTGYVVAALEFKSRGGEDVEKVQLGPENEAFSADAPRRPAGTTKCTAGNNPGEGQARIQP